MADDDLAGGGMTYQIGDVREDGAILSKAGWTKSGVIWIRRPQANIAVGLGWEILDDYEKKSPEDLVMVRHEGVVRKIVEKE